MPTDDMSHPVTRAELREELAKYPTREDLREELAKYPTREDLREELANYPTREELRETLREELANYPTRQELHEALAKKADKTDLDVMSSALIVHITTLMDSRFETYDARLDRLEAGLDARFKEFRSLIADDMTRVLGSFVEDVDRRLRLALEPTFRVEERVDTLDSANLPARVSKLEAAVFPPKRQRRR